MFELNFKVPKVALTEFHTSYRQLAYLFNSHQYSAKMTQHIEINTKAKYNKNDFVSRFKIDTLNVEKFKIEIDKLCMDIINMIKT